MIYCIEFDEGQQMKHQKPKFVTHLSKFSTVKHFTKLLSVLIHKFWEVCILLQAMAPVMYMDASCISYCNSTFLPSVEKCSIPPHHMVQGKY